MSAAAVNLATHRAEIGLARAVDAETLAAAVRTAGYDAHVVTAPVADDAERRERELEVADVRRRFAIGLSFGAVVFVLAHV